MREKINETPKEISLEELQKFVNNPNLDLPELRRDLSNPQNLKWLSQNIGIRNEVPENIVRALRKKFNEYIQSLSKV